MDKLSQCLVSSYDSNKLSLWSSSLQPFKSGMACEAQISSRNTDSNDAIQTTNEEDESNYEYVTVPPDGGYGWIVTAASLLCLLISDGILFSFGLILTDLKQVFDVPVAQVAWIFSIVNGSSLISGLSVLLASNSKSNVLFGRSRCFCIEQSIWFPYCRHNRQFNWFCWTIHLFFRPVYR